jgi:hypothetical protein
VSVRLSKAVFSSDKNSRGQLTLASSGGKAILSPSRGYTKSTPFGGGSFKKPVIVKGQLVPDKSELSTKNGQDPLAVKTLTDIAGTYGTAGIGVFRHK